MIQYFEEILSSVIKSLIEERKINAWKKIFIFFFGSNSSFTSTCFPPLFSIHESTVLMSACNRLKLEKEWKNMDTRHVLLFTKTHPKYSTVNILVMWKGTLLGTSKCQHFKHIAFVITYEVFL